MQSVGLFFLARMYECEDEKGMHGILFEYIYRRVQ